MRRATELLADEEALDDADDVDETVAANTASNEALGALPPADVEMPKTNGSAH